MPKCDVCGNDYDETFQITQAGKTSTFDSFECAIHAMATLMRPLRLLNHHEDRWLMRDIRTRRAIGFRTD
jgi:hypothetical protein